MSIFYFMSQDGKTRVTLDCEKEASVSYPSSVSKASTSAGKTISHQVVEGNAIISVSGLVTVHKAITKLQNLSPLDFQEEINAVRRNATRFTLYLDFAKTKLIKDFKDCVISNAEVVLSNKMDTIEVSLTFEQVFITDSAKTVFFAPIVKDASNVGNSKFKGKGTKTDVGAANKNKSLFVSLFGVEPDK